MKSPVLDNILWGAGFIGHIVLVLILFTRKRVKSFPIFSAFLAFETLTTFSLFLISRYGTRHLYALVYWITGFIVFAFPFALIVEFGRDVLQQTGWWLREVRKSLLVWGLLGIIVAVGFTFEIVPPGKQKSLNLWQTRSEFFLSLIMCGSIVVISSIAGLHHLYRRRQVVALANGFFTISYSILFQDLAHVILGWNRDIAIVDYIVMFLYLAVLVYWMMAFWNSEKEQPPPSAEMIAYMVALHEQVKYDLTKLKGPRQ